MIKHAEKLVTPPERIYISPPQGQDAYERVCGMWTNDCFPNEIKVEYVRADLVQTIVLFKPEDGSEK